MRRPSTSAVVTLLALSLVGCSSSDGTTPATTALTTTVAPVATDGSTTTVEVTTSPTATIEPTTVPERPYALWDEVAPPVLPTGHTTPFIDNGTLLDGAYWVEFNAGTVLAPDVTVEQAFFGDECETVAVQMGDECLNDVFVLSPPNRIVDDLPFAPDAVISVSNPNTQASFGITPEELVQLSIGAPASAGAPSDYLFVPFGWLMTVVDGVITRFEQVWTP